MGEAIGKILPLAIAVAISPLPIIVVVLILVSEHASVKGLLYLLTRLVCVSGIVAIVVVALGSNEAIMERHEHPSGVAIGLRIGFGCLLLAWAVRKWFTRPESGTPPEPNPILRHLTDISIPRSVLLGFLFAVPDLETSSLAVIAGLSIAEVDLSVGQSIGAGAIFVVVATITTIVPVLAYVIGGAKAARHLERLNVWLVANDNTVMIVLLVVIGTMMIGRAIETIAK
ncbi:GAP family protein [Skermania sp. ID1734]|uniref:GAP family protein n=1 Tax=Skermania sp. ID1734 TaxID=2597516 RepID=UPI001180C059|nr:GAP family protein [Skermania sp. ID1734]TSE01958.1 GAP family protein [Skermania sp. ID1734]